jgi:hypothetical protein
MVRREMLSIDSPSQLNKRKVDGIVKVPCRSPASEWHVPNDAL